MRRRAPPWFAAAGLALAVATGAPAAATPPEPTDAWLSPIGRGHPLAGRIWDVAAQGFITEDELTDRLVDVRYVVTGESHNNPDHHRLQLRLLRAMFGNGRRVAVGLEIFTSDEQALLDRYGALTQGEIGDLVDHLGWGRRRRPLWEQYRPLVQFAGESGLPLVAMDLSRAEIAALRAEGLDALPAAMVGRFALDQPLPDERAAILVRDLWQAHCGMLFTQNLDGQILAQRARDATMATRLLDADVGAGALLLAGYGHARGDRGVPYLLADLHQKGGLVNLLFASVKTGLDGPADYRSWFGGDRLPFDYVWFTARVDDEDPCERLQRIYGRSPAPPPERP